MWGGNLVSGPGFAFIINGGHSLIGGGYYVATSVLGRTQLAGEGRSEARQNRGKPRGTAGSGRRDAAGRSLSASAERAFCVLGVVSTSTWLNKDFKHDRNLDIHLEAKVHGIWLLRSTRLDFESSFPVLVLASRESARLQCHAAQTQVGLLCEQQNAHGSCLCPVRESDIVCTRVIF